MTDSTTGRSQMNKYKNLTGQRFGNLTVVRKTDNRTPTGGIIWECICDCGNTRLYSTTKLNAGDAKSCGCLHKHNPLHIKKLNGKTFGRLTVIQYAGLSEKNKALWECICTCGKKIVVMSTALVSGNTQSCGCLRDEAMKIVYEKHLPKLHQPKSFGESARNSVYARYQKQSKRRNIPFEISLEFFSEITKKDCFYCGISPTNVESRNYTYGSYTYNGIDRYDNSKGYTVDNCVPCCKRCNLAKNDMTIPEFKSWLEKIYSRKEVW